MHTYVYIFTGATTCLQQDAAAFAAAVAHWRDQRAAGGGAAQIVEQGGDFDSPSSLPPQIEPEPEPAAPAEGEAIEVPPAVQVIRPWVYQLKDPSCE
jgi:hypothetical protein